MEIRVENKGKPKPYKVHWNESIKRLKEKVSKTETIPIDNLNLVLNRKRLENDQKWFQTQVFDHGRYKDTTAGKSSRSRRTSASGREEIPVVQVVNR